MSLKSKYDKISPSFESSRECLCKLFKGLFKLFKLCKLCKLFKLYKFFKDLCKFLQLTYLSFKNKMCRQIEFMFENERLPSGVFSTEPNNGSLVWT